MGLPDKGTSGLRPEGVVPVVDRRAQPLHGGIERHHGVGHDIPGLVGVKPAVDGAAVDVTSKPSGVRPRTGSRDAVQAGMQDRTADGIDR